MSQPQAMVDSGYQILSLNITPTFTVGFFLIVHSFKFHSKIFEGVTISQVTATKYQNILKGLALKCSYLNFPLKLTSDIQK